MRQTVGVVLITNIALLLLCGMLWFWAAWQSPLTGMAAITQVDRADAINLDAYDRAAERYFPHADPHRTNLRRTIPDFINGSAVETARTAVKLMLAAILANSLCLLIIWLKLPGKKLEIQEYE